MTATMLFCIIAKKMATTIVSEKQNTIFDVRLYLEVSLVAGIVLIVHDHFFFSVKKLSNCEDC